MLNIYATFPFSFQFYAKGKLIKETEKALLIKFKSGKEIWLPKSTLKSDYMLNQNVIQVFEFNDWILKKKGITIEKEVLLICPGFFANQGLWEGISIATLLKEADADTDISHVTIHGPEGDYTKIERFSIKDVLAEKVFLAYRLNGERLPVKHGFPLRVVAEDYYGSDWVKYVFRVTAYKMGEDRVSTIDLP